MPPRKTTKPSALPPIEENPGVQTAEATGQPMVEQEGDQLTDSADEAQLVKEPEPGALDETLGQLGDAVRREDSGYDLSETAHLSAIEALGRIAEAFGFEPDTLVFDVRDAMVEFVKRRPKPWSASSPAEQRDVFAKAEQVAQELVRVVCEAVASRGQEPVRVLLDKVSLGEAIQITGKVKTNSAEEEDRAVMILHHARGKHVMLTVASKDDYQQGGRAADVPVEEPGLPFAAGDEEFAAALGGDGLDGASGQDRESYSDDQDREGYSAEDEAPHQRINLKTGMIEQLDDGFEDDPEAQWSDVRQASPAELAQERERLADFKSPDQVEPEAQTATAES